MKLCRLMLGLALCLTLCACAPEPGPAAGEPDPKSAVGQEQPEEPPVQPVSPEKPMPEEEGTKPAEPTGPVPEKPSEPQEPELPAEPAEDGEEILYYRSTGKTPPDGVELPEIPAWDALPKEDRNDYVHRDYGFQVVDSEGNPLPGFRLTLTGNNTETEYIAGYKAQDCTNPDGSGGFTKAPITDLRLRVEGPGRTVEYTWSGAEADVLPDTTQLVWRYDTLDSLMREAPVLDLQFVPSDGEEPHRTDLKIWCENAPEEMSGLLASSEDTSWVSTDNNARFRLVFPRMDADAMKGLRFCYQAEYRVKLPEGGGYAYRAEGTLTADSRTLTAEIPLERDGDTDTARKNPVFDTLCFQVVDTKGNPLPGFQLTLTGGNPADGIVSAVAYSRQDGSDTKFRDMPVSDLRLQVKGPNRTVEYTWTAEEAKALTDTTELVWRYDTLDSLMREVPVLDLQFVRDTGEKQELTDLLIRCPDGPEELAYLAGNPDEDYWLVTDDSGRIQLPLPLLAPDQMKGVIFTYDAKYRVKSLTGNGYTLAAQGTLTADSRTLTAEIPLERED